MHWALLLLGCVAAPSKPRNAPKKPEDKRKRYPVQLLGLYSTGTNLLYDTVHWSYPLCSQNKDKTHLRRDALKNTDVCIGFKGLHKHLNPIMAYKQALGKNQPSFRPVHGILADPAERGNSVMAVMIRDPLA